MRNFKPQTSNFRSAPERGLQSAATGRFSSVRSGEIGDDRFFGACCGLKSALRGSQAHPCAVALFLATVLLTRPDLSHSQNLLLSNAVVHTVSGETMSGGQVLVADGKISAVGASLNASGVTIVDLQGQHLYPGLI